MSRRAWHPVLPSLGVELGMSLQTHMRSRARRRLMPLRAVLGTRAKEMGTKDNGLAPEPVGPPGDAAASATWLSTRAKHIRPSVIVEISRLAAKHNAINLGEGFPDFPAPAALKERAMKAIDHNLNQYRYDASLASAIARKFELEQGIAVHPESQVVITVGQSGAMAAALLAVLDPGDEVLLLDPSFEAYAGAVRMAGGVPRHVLLTEPFWSLDMSSLEQAVTARTKVLILNSPCNPTGKVFSVEELALLTGFCITHNLLVITDEVYEHFIYDSGFGKQHRSIAGLPGMSERTIVTSSLSKTFSVTGWRLGWAIAPTALSAAIGAMSLKMVDSPPAPFQEAAKAALEFGPGFYRGLAQDFERRRDIVVSMLKDVGLEVAFVPSGGYFVFARLPRSLQLDDVGFCQRLIEQAGVAMVPGRIFFGEAAAAPESEHGSCCFHHAYVRVAICKSYETLQSARLALQTFELDQLTN